MQTNSKIIIVSGGTSGVGRQTAIDIANRGCHTVILGRSLERNQIVVQELIQQTKNNNIEALTVDLTSTDSIKKLIATCQAKFDHIDGLVNAAGAMFQTLRLGADGLDQNLGLNYFGPYQLIKGLLPQLKKATQGRILTVAGLPLIVRLNKATLPSLTPTNPYNANRVFAESLTARILLTRALAQQLDQTNVTINVFHPGNVSSSHFGSDSPWYVKLSGQIMAKFSAQNTAVGAHLMTDPQFDRLSGQFFDEHCKIVKIPAKYSLTLANQLIKLTENTLQQ